MRRAAAGLALAATLAGCGLKGDPAPPAPAEAREAAAGRLDAGRGAG
jgi:nitrous oxide reductase accessory protein NosL